MTRETITATFRNDLEKIMCAAHLNSIGPILPSSNDLVGRGQDGGSIVWTKEGSSLGRIPSGVVSGSYAAGTWGIDVNMNLTSPYGIYGPIPSGGGGGSSGLVMGPIPLKTVQYQRLHSGDLIVCKNDHPICIVMEDFDLKDDGTFLSKLAFWQQEKPIAGQRLSSCECAKCRASYTELDHDASMWKFIIRPAPTGDDTA